MADSLVLQCIQKAEMVPDLILGYDIGFFVALDYSSGCVVEETVGRLSHYWTVVTSCAVY